MSNLDKTEYAPFYQTYISQVLSSGKNIVENLEESHHELLNLLQDLPENKQLYAYAPGKWTLKELLQHLIDTERIFAYRALRIARKDKTPLPGFDENNYVTNCNANSRVFSDLLEDFSLTRQSTVVMFKSFTKDMLLQTGTMSNSNASVRAIGYICSGHVKHHTRIIRERYL